MYQKMKHYNNFIKKYEHMIEYGHKLYILTHMYPRQGTEPCDMS